MIVTVQRVSEAKVEVNQEVVGQISRGLLLLIGIDENDVEEDALWLVQKIINLRIFGDSEGKMNLSVKDTEGELLCISQFTLIADYKKGNRPGFTRAAKPDTAIPLYEFFIGQCAASGLKTEKGIFGADMKVSLVNDGPVTLVLNSRTKS